VGAAGARAIHIFHPQVFTGVKTKSFHESPTIWLGVFV
jgi:hypothetical protein